MVKNTAVKLATLSLLVLGLLVSGCVTTTDSRFTREADREKALENYVKLASRYIAQGNLTRARHHLERAFEIDDDYAPALATMGLVYSAEGDERLSEQSFKDAVSADGKYTRGRVYYGAFLYSQGEYREARAQFAKASEDTAYKDRGGVFYNLGMTQERLGELAQAEQAYRRAVELTRGEARTLLSLARVLVEQGEYSAASRYYSRLQVMIQNTPRLVHSAESLYTGIRIARHFKDRDQEASLALLLRNEFAESEEYQQYKVLVTNGQ
ncbi:type IV pilus biogenesis/stability protein PilW [Marinobacter litoralis]|uniref:type IV pilus biogenesis/stability protein PilW n=1 Tax=Marinobacter litoralis TaxID=187981 RepID=UPI0018EB0149|nr:type IV pilus biogenesis/stability protein PilW [Marinobacter litoralis]MBJ6138051.1 type IV pilus biogenesis/stability protein PilW [Marinobacter litoralis]